MKKSTFSRFAVAAFMVVTIISVSACATTVRTTASSRPASKPLPPGQAKKISGDKSAKRFAPGQNK